MRTGLPRRSWSRSSPSYENVPIVRFTVSNQYGEMAHVSTDLSLRRVVRRHVFGEE